MLMLIDCVFPCNQLVSRVEIELILDLVYQFIDPLLVSGYRFIHVFPIDLLIIFESGIYNNNKKNYKDTKIKF